MIGILMALGALALLWWLSRNDDDVDHDWRDMLL
jgi:hypothetical protein